MKVPDPAPPENIRGLTFPALHVKWTREGQRLFRECRIPLSSDHAFQQSWRTARRAWLERGFSLRNESGGWIVQQWLVAGPEGYQLTPSGIERLANTYTQSSLPLKETVPELILSPLSAEIEGKLRGYQVAPARQLHRAIVNGRAEWGYSGAVDLSDMGVGKAQPIDTMVLTPVGWKAIGEIKVGDEVISQNGKPTRVNGVFPQGVKVTCRVSFSDGSHVRCCEDHLWRVKTPNQRARKQPGEVKATKDMVGDLRTNSGSKWFIPMVEPVEFAPSGTLPIDPYLLGVVIGDGCLRTPTPRITIVDGEIAAGVIAALPEYAELRRIKSAEIEYSICGDGGVNKFALLLSELGLMGKLSDEKFIPRQYMFASIDDRLSLLQGLFDTDGCASKVAVEYSTSSPRLAWSVRDLVESLGGIAIISAKEEPRYTHNGKSLVGKRAYRVRASLPPQFSPFRLKRKAAALKDRTKYPIHRAITSIDRPAREECVCISVEDPSRLYVTECCIVTHNTYMALGAALQTGRQVCVLCPSVGQGGWSRAFAHFGAEPYFIGTYEAVRGSWRENIVSADSTGKFTWKNPSSIVLILDEAQALRHDDTLTTRCCAAAIRQGVPIIIASATVATSPLEMRFAGRITGLHNGDDDWRRFLSDHGCVKSGESWKWDGRIDHLKRIHGRLFPRRGCRVRKEDLGEECPETRIEVLRVDVPEGARLQKEWRDVADLIERLEKQRAPKHYIVTARRKARMAAWKACEMALVEPIAKLAKDDMQNGRSVAIFMNFNETRMRMGDLIGSHDGFYGGQPIKHRQQLERDFQANRILSLVSNIGAGGASVSLHDVTGERPRSAYIFPTDDVVKMVQATGRIDRTGGKSLSLQYIVCVRGAMTEEIVQRTRRKMGAIDSVNDGYKAAGGRF